MSKSSSAISLILLGAVSAGYVGYKAVAGPRGSGQAASSDSDYNAGTDFDDEALAAGSTNPSSQPSGHSGSSHSSYTHRYNYVTSSGNGNASSFSGSHGDESHGSGGHISGTSRGGFGSTGHAAGHAGS